MNWKLTSTLCGDDTKPPGWVGSKIVIFAMPVPLPFIIPSLNNCVTTPASVTVGFQFDGSVSVPDGAPERLRVAALAAPTETANTIALATHKRDASRIDLMLNIATASRRLNLHPRHAL